MFFQYVVLHSEQLLFLMLFHNVHKISASEDFFLNPRIQHQISMKFAIAKNRSGSAITLIIMTNILL